MQIQALYHKVQIELDGIPPHVWEYSTGADLLRPFCSLVSLDPDTASQMDLSTFKITAWTTRPELIPDSRILVVLEPMDEESPFYPLRRTLNYNVQIRVCRLFMRLPSDSPPPSPPPTPPPTDDDTPEHKCKRSRRLRDRFHSERQEATDEEGSSGSPVRNDVRLAMAPMSLMDHEHYGDGSHDNPPALTNSAVERNVVTTTVVLR